MMATAWYVVRQGFRADDQTALKALLQDLPAVASLLPARRAGRLRPSAILRAE